MSISAYMPRIETKVEIIFCKFASQGTVLNVTRGLWHNREKNEDQSMNDDLEGKSGSPSGKDNLLRLQLNASSKE